MKLKVNYVLVLILVIVAGFNGFAGHEYGNGRIQGAPSFSVNATYTVQDNKYLANTFSVTPTAFAEASHRTLVKLGIDNLGIATYTNAFDITVNVQVNSLTWTGSSFTPNTTTVNLSVKYDPASGVASYKDIDTYFLTNAGYSVDITVNSIYDNINSNNLTYAPQNVYLETEIDAERYYKINFVDPPFASVGDFTVTNVSASEELELNWNSITGAEEYELEWCWVSYDILANFNFDIDFKNNATRIRTSEHFYKISKVFEKGYVFFRVRGVGRYDVNSNSLFEAELFSPWSWDDSKTSFTVATTAATLATTFTIGLTGVSGNVPLFYKIDEASSPYYSHETLKNWQYSSTYAEDGKKKEVISYYDGTLRNRQSVTKNNSDNNAIVGETYYDYQGRPAVQALPVPVQDATIKFYEYNEANGYGFNYDMTTQYPYSRGHFDLDGGSCPPNATGMDNMRGSAYYYSSSNSDLNAQQAYIPNAEHYPFTQTEYTPDLTGRIRRQSNVGADLKLGSNHETKYFYGSPTGQTELDRLFGSEVGFYNHYKKNMVIDPNGQISVTYTDLSGKTIATGLAGSSPSNLKSLSASTSSVNMDLLNKASSSDPDTDLDNNILAASGKELVFTKEMLVTDNGTYMFKYDMTGTAFTYSCNEFCYDCIYDLEIDIVDACGVRPTKPGEDETVFTPIKKKVGNILPAQTNTVTGVVTYELNCDGPVTFSDLTASPIYVVLNPGVYTVTKRLTIDEAALSFYLNAYINDTINPGCVDSEYDFVTAATASVDISSCDVDCEDCVNALGSLASFTTTGGGTVAQYNELVRQCREPCSYTDECESNYNALLADVSPGGQYAQYDNGGCDPSAFPVSVLNISNSLPSDGSSGNADDPVWTNTNVVYKNDDGTSSYITITAITTIAGTTYTPAISGIYTPTVAYPATPWVSSNTFTVIPQALADVCEFKNRWKSSWAKELVKFHPEYAYYEYCIQNSVDNDVTYNFSVGITSPSVYTTTIQTSKDYDSLLLVIDDLTNVSAGIDRQRVFDPLGIYTGSSPYTLTTTAVTNCNDPYFNELTADVWEHPLVKSAKSTTSLTVQFDNAYYTQWGSYKSARDRFLNFQNSGIDLWKFAYATVNCGTTYSLTSFSGPPTCLSGYAGPSAFNKKEWETFKMLYKSLKQQLQNEAAQAYALHHQRPSPWASAKQYNSCNDCIGNPGYDPIPTSFSQIDFWSAFSYGNWYDNWFYFPTDAFSAPCGYINKDLYAGKIKRFPSTSNISGLVSSTNPNATIYQLTGKCPVALDLEATLNQMAVAGTTTLTPNTALTTVSAFTKILYDAVYGGTSAYTGLTWNPTVSGKSLTTTFKDGSTTKCTMNLDFPTLPSYATWTCTITKMYDLNFVTYSGGTSKFTIKATVLTPTASVYEDVVLSGTVCANIAACAFDPPCTANGNAKALQNLLGTLIQNGDVCSPANITVTSAPYNAVFNNSLGLLLPSGTWNYTYTSASTTSSISAGGAEHLGITFSGGMSALCTLTSSTNSNSITVISVMPAAGPTGSFSLLYSSMSGSVSTLATVTGSISITNSASVTSGLSVGTCDIAGPLCTSKEHLIRNDLELFIADAEGKNYFTSASTVNFSSNPLFTPLLQSQINSTVSVATSTPFAVPVNQFYWTNSNVTSSVVASNTFSANICSSTSGSSVSPNSSCCSLAFSLNPSISMTQYDIAALGPLTVLSNPTTGGQSYNFYMTAKFFDGVTTTYDTLWGATSCFPIRGCETCTAVVSFSTIAITNTVVDNFSTLATSTPIDHTGTSPCAGSFNSFNTTTQTYSACDYGIANAITDGSTTYSGYSGKSYWIILTNGPTSYSTTVYDRSISISSTQKCYGLDGFYIKAVDWNHYLDLYLDNKYIGTQVINWEGPMVTPTWHKLNFGSGTWNNTTGVTSLNIKIIARPILPPLGIYQGDLATILGIDELTLYEVPCGTIPCVNENPTDTFPVITYTNPCAQLLYNAAVQGALEDYANYVDSLKTEFVEGYIKKCMGSAIENFSVTYSASEYQYTLYYYDQAGNLVRTVPPEGVSVITNTATLATIKAERYSYPTKTQFTNHGYKTTYTYNSLNQLEQQETPDAGVRRFWYDVLGRLTASQDAEQYAAGTKRYSYTKYDPLGRIFETGQVAPNSPATDLSAQSGSTLIATLNPTVGNFPDNIVSTSTLMTQVVHTYYGDEDRYLTLTPTASLALKPTTFLYSTDFSRSRVVAVSLEQNNDLVDTTFNHATFYNYDIHGNVKELSQHNPDTKWAGGHEDKKHMYYDYDLISGKVNKVSYQPGYADQFFHKYEYDADNRITHVYTSSDDVLWDNDAKYFYYKHGPLARMEIGNDKVQGYDYAYTLQGWIKGTNSELLTNTKDIGKDANTYTTSTNYNTLNARFAKDAAAYNLNYFTRTGPVYDYLTASTTYTPASASFKADALSISTSTTNKPLYNGNIGHMTTSYLNMDPSATHPVTGGTVAVYEPVIQLSGYRYDQLNRITDVNISKDLNTATNTWGTGTTTAYKEAFTYDKNGNIITAKRNYNNNGTFPTMDDLSYTYSASTNKLSYVDDAISLSAPTDDIEDQAVNNYTMYLNGNLKADAQENITNINWSIYGKPLKISKTAGDLTFRYDAMGNRISKRWHTAASSATTDVITYYVRDAQGNTMATYQEAPITGTVGLTLEEHNVYGSSRLGNVQHVLTVTASPAPAANPTHTVGEKNFELSNHLGNVLSVVNDHKATVTTTNSACVGVMDFAPGYDVTSWELQVNGVTATSLAIGAVQVQYTSGAITGINPAFGPNVTPGDYLLEFDWDPGNCDASDNLQIEPFDVQWSGGFPVTFYMSTPFWATGTVPAKGHYTFTYTPSATASDIWTHIAFNNWGAATNHTFVIDNISMCPLSTPATIVDYHNPDIVSHSDYYAFGANKPGTQWTSLSSPYRYTFNGKEKDGEAVSTSGGTQDYGARIYNPSLGRFLSVDPITHQYPQLTPFQFAGNTPIACADIDGEEPDPKYVQTNYGSIVLEKPDGYTLQQLLDELKKPLTPKTPAPVEVPSVFSRLLLTVGFVLTPHSIGEETTSWEYEQMQEAWRKMHAKPEDIIIITTDPSTLTDEYLGLVRSRLMNGTASDQDKLYRSEVQKRIVGANDKYVVNPQHDPSSGKYKSNKSVLPSNHQALWEKRSYYDEKKDEWWSVEGEGKKAVYHRFKGDNGIYHWNGSSNGTTKSGTEYKIKQDHIPNDAKKQSIRKF